jgi:hypothetical protein
LRGPQAHRPPDDDERRGPDLDGRQGGDVGPIVAPGVVREERTRVMLRPADETTLRTNGPPDDED